MVTVIGLIATVIGLAGMILKFTGMGKAIPGFTELPISLTAYAIIFGVGVVMAMLSRRPSD